MEQDKDLEAIKLGNKIYQWLIILSIPLIICFYWPNHEVRLMKFEAMEFCVMSLIALSCLSEINKRKELWPGIFLFVCLINAFTHLLSPSIMIALNFVIFSVLGFYYVHNYITLETINLIKKSIVYTCLLNGLLFLVLMNHFDLVFQIGPHGRPAGFMCYPIGFSLLCAISLFISWEWKKWLCIPIGILLLMSQEYSVILATLLAISTPYWKKYWYFIFPLGLITIASFLFIHHGNQIGIIERKIDLRFKYLEPIIVNMWSRIIDGWGIGSYRFLPTSFFGFDRNNWSEMHCEPLDLVFSMGIMGIAVFIGFINSLRKYFTWNKYTKSFLIIGVASCFHSPFHFADTLWLIIVLYSMYKVELYEGNP